MRSASILISSFIVCSMIAAAADEPCPAKPQFNNTQSSVRLPGVRRTGNRVLVSVRINGRKEDLLFILDKPFDIDDLRSAVERLAA